jgi:hypothetical protein
MHVQLFSKILLKSCLTLSFLLQEFWKKLGDLGFLGITAPGNL